MKKVFSLILVLMVVFTLLSSVYAGEKKDRGSYITEERITQEAVEAVEEVAEWKAAELSRVYSNSQYPVDDAKWNIVVELDELNYSISAKYNNLALKEITGTFEQAEGEQIIKLECYGEDYLTFTFAILKEIITPAIEAVPEVKTLFYTGYEYKNGCKVMFNEKLKLADKKALDRKKPFVVGKSKVWCKWWRKIYLYKACDWQYSEPTTTTDEVTTTEAETTTPSEDIIEEEEVTTSAVIVENNTVELPKTGEDFPIKIKLLGVIIAVTGLLVYLKFRFN
jgi:LPXTG-motif cell wall-anchored protein